MNERITWHPTPIELELFLRNSPGQDKPSRDAIATHLSACDVCRMESEELERFHAIIAAMDETPSGDAIRIARQVMAAETPTARIFELHPRSRKRESRSGAPRTIALAAQDAGRRERFTPLGTLVSEDAAAVIRIQRDNERNDCILQLTTDDPASCAHAQLAFDRLPGTYYTDRNGELRLALPEEVDLQSLHAFVRLADIEWTWAERDQEMLRAESVLHIVLRDAFVLTFRLSEDRQTIRIECARDGNILDFIRFFLQTGEASHECPIENGSALFPVHFLRPGTIVKGYLPPRE